MSDLHTAGRGGRDTNRPKVKGDEEVTTARRYQSEHRDKKREYQRRYRAAHPERVRAYQREYRRAYRLRKKEETDGI